MKNTIAILFFLPFLCCLQSYANAANTVVLTINNFTEDELKYESIQLFAGDLTGSIPPTIPPGNSANPSAITVAFNPTLSIWPKACGSDPSSECVLFEQFYYDAKDTSYFTIQYSNQSGDHIHTHCDALGTPTSHDICSIQWSPTNPIVNIRKN